MTLLKYITIENRCSDPITVHLRVLRPKKGLATPAKITVLPGYPSSPIPYALLAGTPDWDSLSRIKCVKLVETRTLPPFHIIQNVTSRPLDIRVSPPAPREKKRVTTLHIRPGRKSPPISLRAVSRSRLDRLVDLGSLKVEPVSYLAPTTRPAPVAATYFGEDVYICYKCGRPIVFRGHPPTPIHV